MRTRPDVRPRIAASTTDAPGRRPLSAAYHPRSKAALLANARQVARLARGRAAFVQRARVLPVGLPLGAAVAALRYQRRRARGASVADAAAAAGLALLATITLTRGAAQLEWELRRLAHQRRHG